MRKLSIFIGGMLFSFFIRGAGLAQPPVQAPLPNSIASLQRCLADAGLENLQVELGRHRTVWISYENRRYRNEITALGIVLGYAAACLPFADHLVIVPKYRNVPLKYLQVDRAVVQQFIQQQISVNDFLEQLRISYRAPSEKPLPGYSPAETQSSLFRFDLITSPGVKTQFARPHDPAQLQFNMLTDLSFTMARGLQFSSQWIFPLYNEFESRESQSRAGHCYLNQLVRLPGASFLTLSVGMFDYQCFGFSSKVRRFFLHDNSGGTAGFPEYQRRDRSFSTGGTAGK